MAHIADDAVTLRRFDFSETSQVLSFFTRGHGQRRLIAKGIKRGTKRAFATGIDLLEAGRAVFIVRDERGAGLGTLTEWHQSDIFLGLREKLDRLYAGQYAAEVLAQLTEEGDPHPELYDEIVRLLGSLSGGGGPIRELARFQRALLLGIGLLPAFDACAACGRADAPLSYFSATQGGMICRDCEPAIVEKRRMDRNVIAACTGPIEKLSPAAARDAFDLFDYAIAHAMGRPARLAEFVHSLAR